MKRLSAPAKGKPLYAALGVAENASDREIRDAFMRVARRHHPDVAGGVLTEAYTAAAHAYAILKDPQMRADYDRTGIDPGDVSHARQSVAMGIISRKAFEVLASDGGEGNVLDGIRTSIRGDIAKNQKTVRDTPAVVANIKKARRNISDRWNGAESVRDAVFRMIDQQLESDVQNLALAKQNIETLNLALRMLESATYEVPGNGWMEIDMLRYAKVEYKW